jgi:hypothetical protein
MPRASSSRSRRGDQVFAGRAEECRARGGGACRGGARPAARSARSASSPAASMPRRSTSARWKAWPGPGPSTRSTPTGRRCGRVEAILAMASRTSADRAGPEQPLRVGGARRPEDVPLPVVEAWPLMERLAAEFETVGILPVRPSARRIHAGAEAHGRGDLGVVPRQGGEQGGERGKAGRHRHPPPGAALEVRQPLCLRRPVGPDRAIRGDLLFRHAGPGRDLLEPGNRCWPASRPMSTARRCGCGCSRWRSSMPRRRRLRAAGHRAGRCEPGGEDRREARQWRARAGAGGAARRKAGARSRSRSATGSP